MEELIFQAVAEVYHLDADAPAHTHSFARLEMASMFALAKELDERGHDWRDDVGRPDLPASALSAPLPILFAPGTRSSVYDSITVSVGALAYIVESPCRNISKDGRGISLCQISGSARRKEEATAVTGLGLDDDGMIGKDKILAALNSPGAPLTIAFATASNGKSSDEIDAVAFNKFSKDNRLPAVPTNSTMAEYLNQHCEHGPAFRDVQTARVPTEESNGSKYPVTFAPQERTRVFVPYARPVTGETLRELIERGVFKLFCRAVELEVLGCNGCDSKTLQPVAVAYLPSGTKPNFFSGVFGGPHLFDPVPVAERILAENPKRDRPALKIGGAVQTGTLRGLMLATLIAEQFPELAAGPKTTPLVLRRCPFAYQHSSKRGQADRSAYVFDPDPEGGAAWPTVKCHHDSCRDRLTQDFVAAMIESGELDSFSVYQSTDNRIPIETEDPTAKLADLLTPRK